MADITTILLPTRPQPDTIVAMFLLKKFGTSRFPTIEAATVKIQATLGENETFETLLDKGALALDLGGGALDHHNKNLCTSELVAKYLGIEKNPSIGQMLSYAKRDDKDGKGTISRDALDRAFGLSGLIAALNKANPQHPQYVVDAVLPLLEAHWRSAQEHHVELPLDIERKRTAGEYTEQSVTQGQKSFKVVSVISDKASMPTYLRSERGGKADVVVQKLEHSNHFCILTNQKRGVDLSKIAALIRMREAELQGIEISEDEKYLSQTRRVEEIPYWYFDPATNSLLNGGLHNQGVAESLITWDELIRIVQTGLELGTNA
jgi:hypothetical protein